MAEDTKKSAMPPTDAEATKKKDLQTLDALKKEYAALKLQAADKKNPDVGKSLARKGDVTRAMDAIKRTHNLE
jgi:hypothetical protein